MHCDLMATSEDKAIMLMRSQLESYWTASISPGDQALWIAKWMTRPPNDAHGRTYILGPKTSVQQTVRPPQTVYAWSQMYRSYRYGYSPASSPSGTPEATVQCVWAEADADHMRVRVRRSDTPGTAWPCLIYISPCLSPSTTATPYQLTFMVACYVYPATQTIDCKTQWYAANTRTAGAPVMCAAYTLTEDGGLSLPGMGDIIGMS